MLKIIGRIKRISIKTRYIISYMVIAALPIITLSLAFYDNQFSDLKQSIAALQSYRLEQVCESFDNRFGDIREISAAIASDYKLRPDYMLSLRSNEIEAISLLTAYNRRNTLTEDIYLYLFENDAVYAKDGRMSLSTMTDILYNMDDANKARFIGQFQQADSAILGQITVSSASCQKASPENNILLMTYPLRLTGSKPYGMLLFFIHPEVMQQIMAASLDSVEGTALILDASGGIIAGSVPGALKMSQVTESILGQAGDGIINLAAGNASWSVVQATSAETGLHYASVLPNSVMHIQLFQLKIVIFQLSVTLLVIAIFLAAIMAWMNYRPINKLMKVVGISKPQVNELDAIKSSMLSYIDHNKQLRALIDQHASFEVEHVIELLLGGSLTAREADDLLAEKGQAFRLPFFQIVVIDLHNRSAKADWTTSLIKNDVLHQVIDLEMIYHDELRIYYIERVNDNTVILLLNIAEQDEENSFARIITDRLNANANESLFAGIGYQYSGSGKIQKSFVEAMAALEYVRFQQKGGLLHFKEIVDQDLDRYTCPQDELKRLIHSIRQGSTDMALQSLQALYVSVSSSQASSFKVRCVLIDIINILIKNVTEIEPNQFQAYVRDLMTVKSLNKFNDDMQKMIPVVCAYVINQQTSSVKSLLDQMLLYVEEHFTDADISLESVAGHFKLSTFYVSRFFSEQAQLPFKDYISRLRVEYAKGLLTETNLPLHDIVLKIGYYNTSSFIKKFRSFTGMTPGEWRYQENSGIKFELSSVKTQEASNGTIL